MKLEQKYKQFAYNRAIHHQLARNGLLLPPVRRPLPKQVPTACEENAPADEDGEPA